MQIEVTNELVRRAIRGLCIDCGEHPPHYMVIDRVWDAAWMLDSLEAVVAHRAFRDKLAEHGALQFPDAPLWGSKTKQAGAPRARVWVLLCFPCLERRLNRKLTIDDFQMKTKDGSRLLPINEGIFFGYALGLKDMGEPGDKK